MVFQRKEVNHDGLGSCSWNLTVSLKVQCQAKMSFGMLKTEQLVWSQSSSEMGKKGGSRNTVLLTGCYWRLLLLSWENAKASEFSLGVLQDMVITA